MPATRRHFLQASIIGSLILLPPFNTANAFWPFILRFIVGGAIRRTTARALISNAGRSAVRTAGSASVRRMATSRVAATKSVRSLGVNAGIVASVSPEVYALARTHNAEAIWIQDGYENEFTVYMKNDSKEHTSAQLQIKIENVLENKIEKEMYIGNIYTAPEDEFRFSFNISDLPYRGVKRIIGETDNPSIQCVPSGNIVVASSHEVRINSG